mgnify:CR=1 FL=1
MTSPSPASTAPYGADERGIICAYRFDGVGPAQPVDAAEAIGIWTTAPRDSAGFVWLHVNLSHAAAERWLRAHAQMPDDFFDAIGEGSRSSRIERDGDTLFAVVNDATFDFSFDASDIATLWISVRAGLVITARRHPLCSVDRLRAAVKRGEVIDSSVALLDHLLRDESDELQHIARRASERIDEIEDQLIAQRTGEHAAELARLRRLTVRLQRLMAPEPGALVRLLSNPPGWLGREDLQRLREASDDFGVSLRDIATLQDRIRLLQDEASARVAEANNRSLFMLTMVTVLALPINLTAGLLGMNVGGIPLAQHEHGFVYVLLAIAGITVGFTLFAWRRLIPPA